MNKIVRIACTVKAVSTTHANTIFDLACTRLLNVHRWTRLTDCLLPSSDLRDSQGIPVRRSVRADDYLNVSHTGTRAEGWMRVEFVSEVIGDRFSDDRELIIMARNVEWPFEADDNTNQEDKPVLFKVTRSGRDITTSLGIESCHFNSLVERTGICTIQWRSLVHGILSDLIPAQQDQRPKFAVA